MPFSYLVLILLALHHPQPKQPTIQQVVYEQAVKEKVNPKLAEAVLYVENGGNFKGCQTRVSNAGAIGPMQLEPVTAQFLHVNPWNPVQNIKGGVRYLRYLLHRFDGSIWLAVEAYNAGPTCVANGDVPPAAVEYAKRVIGRVAM